jgi:hypothetical protein
MTATVTNLPTSQQSDVERDRRKANGQAGGDLLVAARYLFQAQETYRRKANNTAAADRVARVRADLMAVIHDKDTPSEVAYGDLAADASAHADEAEQYRFEVEKLREELESARGDRVHGKGN